MKKVQRVELIYELLRVVLGLTIAYVVTLVLIVITSGTSPVDIIKNFVVGPFTSSRRLGQLMGKFIPYVLSGCGMCFIYNCGRFSLIGEGITNSAPIVACLVLFRPRMLDGLPWITGIAVLLIVCCVVGGVLALTPVCGREKYDTSETVTSVIMNYLLLSLSTWVLKLFLVDRLQSFLYGPLHLDNARFFQLIPKTNLHAGIFISIISWAIACLMLGKMRIGAKIRIYDANGMFAKYSGINTKKTLYLAQFIGGVFTGAAACVDASGMYAWYQYNVPTNTGMDALIAVVIARRKPVFIPLVAFVLAYVRTSAVTLNLSSNISMEFVNMMQAILILFIAAQNFLQKFREKAIFKLFYEEEEAEKGGSVA